MSTIQLRAKAHVAVREWLEAEFGNDGRYDYDEMITLAMKLIRAVLK